MGPQIHWMTGGYLVQVGGCREDITPVVSVPAVAQNPLAGGMRWARCAMHTKQSFLRAVAQSTLRRLSASRCR